MRILLAYDGSDGGNAALGMVAGIDWPEGSVIRVVSVIEPVMVAMAGPSDRGAGFSADLDAAISGYAEERLAAAVDRLPDDGRVVEGAVIRGRAASAILDAARAFDADLIVVGSRGHGGIASLVLGSVSAEIVDHAACPVLVARGSSFGRIVLATDGSREASAAETILADWPIFASTPIHVVSVVDIDLPWTTGIAPTLYTHVIKTYAAELREARQEQERLATAAAERLRAAGRDADGSMREGDAAAEIVAIAGEQGADLVVMGSRGRTGLTRLLLGSVARNVVSGTHASVLIVHATGEAP